MVKVRLYDQIGMFGVTAKDFVSDLDLITAPVIRLHVNCPGGIVDEAVAIYNALMSHPARVEVFVDALAASAASFIAMAGDRRVMQPHSRMMIHEAMGLGVGFAADFEEVAARLRSLTSTIADIYAEHTDKPRDYWLPLMAGETWFTDREAVEEGLAHEVGRESDRNAFQIAASFDLSQYRNAVAFPAELVAPATNAGRTLSRANLASLHGVFSSLRAIHDGACDMGDECPLDVSGEPENRAPEGDPEPSSTPETAHTGADDLEAALEARAQEHNRRREDLSRDIDQALDGAA